MASDWRPTASHLSKVVLVADVMSSAGHQSAGESPARPLVDFPRVPVELLRYPVVYLACAAYAIEYQKRDDNCALTISVLPILDPLRWRRSSVVG